MNLRRVTGIGALVLVMSGQAFAQTVRVSVATDGTPANGDSMEPVLSFSGRFVAFASLASNLVPGDSNGVSDVFLRDRDANENGILDEAGAVSTVRVSQLANLQGNGPSGAPRMTLDGRFVFFESRASSLFSFGQPPMAFSVVLRWERTTGQIVLVSQTAAGEPLNGASDQPAVTDDGNTAFFVTRATNVDGGDVGEGGLVVRRDIAQGTLTRISSPQPRGSDVFGHFIAARPFVAEYGQAYGYAIQHVFVGDLAGTTYAVSNGRQTSFPGAFPQIAVAGQYVIDTFAPPTRTYIPTGGRIALPDATAGAVVSRSGRYAVKPGVLFDLQYGSSIPLPATAGASFDASEAQVAYTRINVVPNRTIVDVVVDQLAVLLTADRDGLDDLWEVAFGLQTSSGIGDDGPDGDPDHDGVTNAQEFARGSNPTGGFTRTFAEGSSSPDFFTTRYALVNPGDLPATVSVRFDRGLLGGGPSPRAFSMPPRSRTTLDSHVEWLDTSAFSAAFESNRPLVADRLMSWGTDGVLYGSHAEASSGAPGTSWFLAEGSTVLGFQLFYLLQNPQETAVTATVRFLLPAGSPVTRTYELGPRSRTTIHVNQIQVLAATDVSAEITATQPIGVERAMYRSVGGQVFGLGHAAAAVPATATTWYFAEGAAGSFFDTFLLLANPASQPATVQVDYFKDAGGVVTRTYSVPADGRTSVYVDGEPGIDGASFGARVTSNVGIVAERAMYWPGGFFDYYEGHVSAGATETGSSWLLAEGETGGPLDAETYVLVSNVTSSPVQVRVRLIGEFHEGGTYSRVLTLPPQSRASVAFRSILGSSSFPPAGRFGAAVQEVGTATNALVVEGAIYWSVAGQPFAAGANWPATRIP